MAELDITSLVIGLVAGSVLWVVLSGAISIIKNVLNRGKARTLEEQLIQANGRILELESSLENASRAPQGDAAQIQANYDALYAEASEVQAQNEELQAELANLQAQASDQSGPGEDTEALHARIAELEAVAERAAQTETALRALDQEHRAWLREVQSRAEAYLNSGNGAADESQALPASNGTAQDEYVEAAEVVDAEPEAPEVSGGGYGTDQSAPVVSTPGPHPPAGQRH